MQDSDLSASKTVLKGHLEQMIGFQTVGATCEQQRHARSRGHMRGALLRCATNSCPNNRLRKQPTHSLGHRTSYFDIAYHVEHVTLIELTIVEILSEVAFVMADSPEMSVSAALLAIHNEPVICPETPASPLRFARLTLPSMRISPFTS